MAPAFAAKPVVAPVAEPPKKSRVPAPNDLCGGREGCNLLWSEAAGKDDKGRELVVSEITVPFKSEYYKCNRPQDTRHGAFIGDVSQEIWLSSYGGLLADHKKLFGFCNNGYGAAGLGEDKIDVGDNQITHREFGGDNQRWMGGNVFRLSPFSIISNLHCDTHTVRGGGRYTDFNYETGLFRDSWSVEQDTAKDFVECDAPDISKAEGKYNGFAVKQIYSFAGIKLDEITALGTCATRITTADGPNQGFITYGQKSSSDAEMAVLRVNDDRLWVDINNKGHAFKSSANWQNDDRVEIWWLDQRPKARRVLRQFIVRLADLKVFAGYGYNAKIKLPEVERREGKQGLRFMIAWPQEQFPLADGFTVSLALSNGQATEAAFSTSDLRYGDAQSLSHTINLQEEDKDTGLGCKMDKDGVLNLIAPK